MAERRILRDSPGPGRGAVLHRFHLREYREAKGDAALTAPLGEEMLGPTSVWPYVAVSFQPSAIAADRVQVWNVVYSGGRVGFARRGAALFSDVGAIRPTVFDVAPVIWNALYAQYRREVADPDLSREEAALVRGRVRRTLGGRLFVINSGGAAIDPGVKQTMERVLGVTMRDGYGTTETGFIARDGVLRDDVDYRLVDRPDLGYTSADRPHPRGELAVRTSYSTVEYVGEKASIDSFTPDGYFLTGDLVQVAPGGRLTFLGRRAEVFKLAGAEFVSPQQLEALYGTSELVENILVWGSAAHAQVAAVVVPARPDVGQVSLLAEMRAIADREALRPCEVPVGVVMATKEGDEHPWTVENGLLTPSHKLRRRALVGRYRGELEGLYEELIEVALLPSEVPAQVQEVLPTLQRLVGTVLRLPNAQVSVDASFVELGGDSLATMEFVLRLEHVFGGKGDGRGVWDDPEDVVHVSLRALAGELCQRVGTRRMDPKSPGGGRPPSRALSDDPLPDRVTSSTTDLASLVAADADAGPRVADVLPVAQSPNVLVTGATGFLGSQVLMSFAERLPKDACVVAVVRAGSDVQARDRLQGVLDDHGYRGRSVSAVSDADSGILAVAGDLGRDRFGLEPATWQRMARGVGLVCHVAGQVSDTASYEDLRSGNVVATSNVLAFAVEEQLKAVHLVSSLNVAHLVAQGGGDEAEALPRSRPLSQKLVAATGGYGLSKWVGERQLMALWRSSGGKLKASISRPALLTWSETTGIANPKDWMTRTLETCLQLRAVPVFEEAGVPGWYPETSASLRGIDMVPVSFAGSAVASLAARTKDREPGPPTVFHVSNLNSGEMGFVSAMRLMDLLVLADLEAQERPAEGGIRSPLAALPFSEWRLRAEIAGAPFVPLLEQFSEGPPTFPPTHSQVFAAAIDGRGLACPAIDLSYLRAWRRRVVETEDFNREIQT